jgi:hypothetical protein
MRAFREVINSGTYQHRAHWCFLEETEDEIEVRCNGLFKQFAAAIEDRRFFAYRAIDVDRFFPALHQFLGNRVIKPSADAARTFKLERQIDDLQAENNLLIQDIDSLKRAQRIVEISQTLSSLSDDVRATREALGFSGDEPSSVRAQVKSITDELRTIRSEQAETVRNLGEGLKLIDSISQNVKSIVLATKGLAWRSKFVMAVMALTALAILLIALFRH